MNGGRLRTGGIGNQAYLKANYGYRNVIGSLDGGLVPQDVINALDKRWKVISTTELIYRH